MYLSSSLLLSLLVGTADTNGLLELDGISILKPENS